MAMRSYLLNFICFSICFLAALVFVQGNAHAQQYPGFADPGARTTAGGSGAGLVAVTGGVDGGVIPTGATAQVVVRFRNDGSQPVETGLIRLYPSSTVSAEVSLNQCAEGALPSGAECAIALSVKALQAGPWRVEMLMSHSGRTRLVTATLSGTVEANGEGADILTSDVEAIPNDLDFGNLEDSQTLVEPIILRNITSNKITLSDVYIDTSEQAGYSLKTECDTLGPGQACIAIVTWSPKLAGRSSGVLVIKHDGPTALTSVSLQGEYAPGNIEEADVFPRAIPGRGLLVSSQTELDFGSNVETASTITVSLVNAGDTNITLNDIKISGSDNGLSFKENGCVNGVVLEPIEACPLTITWSPTRVGSLFDDVQVVHDGARGVLILPIRGEATSTVSQDQKAIVLSDGNAIVSNDTEPVLSSGFTPGDDIQQQQRDAARRNRDSVGSANVAASSTATLDGYKITSFSPDRAIINGPGGSRIVFDNEEIVLGGVPWFVIIQKNGIEFLNHGKRVLLLFDRSLSSINRVSSSESQNSVAGSENSTVSFSADIDG